MEYVRPGLPLATNVISVKIMSWVKIIHVDFETVSESARAGELIR